MLHRLALLLLLLICYPVFSSDLTVPRSPTDYSLVDIRSTGTALNLGDDSVSGNIPLGFNFRLFGRTFNSAWVSNNGVISFTNGNISGYDGAPLNTLGSDYNYALFPLWTDLINSGTTNPYYKLDRGSAIFGWYNSSEYSSREQRSSFEVQIWNNDAFQFRYESVNVRRSPFTIGYTGDISAGEYTQWARHPGGPFSGGNFGFYSDPLSQCNINPLYSIECPGYSEAYLQQQCTINKLFSSSCPGYEQALLEQNCSSNSLYSPQCPGYAAALFEQNCSRNPLYSNQCSGYSNAIAQQLRRTQTSDININSNTLSPVIEDVTKTQTTVDVGGVELTSNGTIAIATGVTDVIKSAEKNQTISVSSDRNRALANRALEVSRTVLLNEAILVNLITDISINSSIDPLQPEKNLMPQDKIAMNVEDTRPTTGRSTTLAQSSVNSSPNVSTGTTEQKTENTLNITSQISDLGEGASFSGLSRAPSGFNTYTSMQLRDAQFYAPREVYRNQQTVDNRNALRLLNGSSDRLHKELVEQQYGR
jgi:hypothetical protein